MEAGNKKILDWSIPWVPVLIRVPDNDHFCGAMRMCVFAHESGSHREDENNGSFDCWYNCDTTHCVLDVPSATGSGSTPKCPHQHNHLCASVNSAVS